MDFCTSISLNPLILMEGALGERIKREFHLNVNEDVALASLVYREDGRIALETLWKEYIDIARRYHLPFLATTPTRRANQERVERSAYGGDIIRRNVELLSTLKRGSGIEMYAGGLMGCKGDAYTGEGALDTDEAIDFHRWAVKAFEASGVDFLYAGIMPILSEALGMAMAMAETSIPYIISFTIQEDGRLIDGHTIDYAISFIDNHVSRMPVCYMTNCVHPDIVSKALSYDFNQTQRVQERFIGIQANTSSLSYAELDHAEDLKTSSPIDWADAMMRLHRDNHFKILGGCCGTDNRHLEEIAKRL